LTPKPTEHGPKGEVIDLPRWDGGLLDHVAGVIEEQLRDHEARMAAAKAAEQEADQRATGLLSSGSHRSGCRGSRPKTDAPRRPSSSGNPRPQSRGAAAVRCRD